MKRVFEGEEEGAENSAGFVIGYGYQSFAAFVEGGELMRMLVRMCVLAEPEFPLSFVLESALAEPVRVRFVVRDTVETLELGAAFALGEWTR